MTFPMRTRKNHNQAPRNECWVSFSVEHHLESNWRTRVCDGKTTEDNCGNQLRQNPLSLVVLDAEFWDRANRIRQHFIDILLRNLTGTKFTQLHSQQNRQKHTRDLQLTLAPCREQMVRNEYENAGCELRVTVWRSEDATNAQQPMMKIIGYKVELQVRKSK